MKQAETPPQGPAGEDRWLSVDEIAAHLGIKRETVYPWITQKNMPAHKVGRLWKFKKAEVDNWVRTGKGTRAAPADPACTGWYSNLLERSLLRARR